MIQDKSLQFLSQDRIAVRAFLLIISEDNFQRANFQQTLISELRTAFQIGFLIYMPFLVIDMVVASVLMSMGMMMLPPAMISLPFKVLLFVLVDGWYLVIESIVKGFK